MAEDDLPFSIHVIGERTLKTYTGDFRARRFLTHRQRLQKDRLYRDNMGTNSAEAEFISHQTALIFSETFVGLSVKPQWWTDAGMGLDLVDENVIVKVWEEMRKIQGEAVKHLEKKGEDAQEELKKVADGTLPVTAT